MATHDTEPETECSCHDCTGIDRKKPEPSELEEEEQQEEKDPLDIRSSPRRKAVTKGNLLAKMQSIFNGNEEASDEDLENDSGRSNLDYDSSF